MPVLRVRDLNGVEHEIEAQAGQKVMEVLRDLDYGVAAQCDRMCTCATCHVYVHADWWRKLPAPMSDERELLAEHNVTRIEDLPFRFVGYGLQADEEHGYKVFDEHCGGLWKTYASQNRLQQWAAIHCAVTACRSLHSRPSRPRTSIVSM